MNVPGLLISFGLLMIAMSVHEFAHAIVAYKLGDNTAKYSGRLTLNPLAHIDPIGTLLLPLLLFMATRGQFVFGAAKPVPINYWALKNPKKDMLWIGLAGPLANFIFAAILSILWRLMPQIEPIGFIFKNLAYINVILGVFNLVPIPPLDGSRIMTSLLPAGLSSMYSRLEPYGFIIVLALVYLGLLDYFIYPLVNLALLLLRL